jgi:hypothetical protein
MAAALGIVWATTAIGMQKAVKSTAKSERAFFRVLIMAVLSEPDLDGGHFSMKVYLPAG